MKFLQSFLDQDEMRKKEKEGGRGERTAGLTK
jgi:hypothetical protein